MTTHRPSRPLAWLWLAYAAACLAYATLTDCRRKEPRHG